MPRDPHRVKIADRIRVQHMIEAARQATRFIRDRNRIDLDKDDLLRRALLHAIQEIGEAGSQVSEESRQRIPKLPWTKIVGMRHLTVHVYWSVNLDVVWEVASRDLPELLAELESAVVHWPLEET